MAQFDVYKNLRKETKRTYPFLLNLQSGVLDDLNTRLVAPLMHSDKMEKRITALMPTFVIEDTKVIMDTLQMASIPNTELTEYIVNLQSFRTEIISAIDTILRGV